MINAMGLSGETESGEPMMMLALEMPSKIAFGGRRLSNRELERVHIEKYRFDILTATGALPFDTVRAGGDPPDFVVETSPGEEGIECAAFALEQRRHAYALFERFRAKVLEAAQREPFPHLVDCDVAVWFGQGDELPPKARDDATANLMVEMLRDAQLDRERIASLNAQIAREGFPEQLPIETLPIFHAADDAGGANITPVEPETLQGAFVDASGFSVRLSMALRVTKSEVQSEFERVVRDHDKPNVDRLLVSVGAPDNDGLVFPGEPLVIQQLPPETVQTEYIGVVTIHMFTSGVVQDLV